MIVSWVSGLSSESCLFHVCFRCFILVELLKVNYESRPLALHLPVVIALMPDDVVGGGLDRIVSMPCGFAAPCGPNCVCVGFGS